jgi:hypothetical protein
MARRNVAGVRVQQQRRKAGLGACEGGQVLDGLSWALVSFDGLGILRVLVPCQPCSVPWTQMTQFTL